MNAAYARVNAESLNIQSRTPLIPMTAEDAQRRMGEYAQFCENEPQNFDEWVEDFHFY